LPRRLCALAYDAIILFALCALVTLGFIPMNRGDAVTGIDTPMLEYFYRTALVAAIAGYSCYCWTHGGQTIGMLAWRLRVVRESGGTLDWPLALRRFAAACVSLGGAGLGLLWVALDPGRRAWHDRWTHTQVIVLPKKTWHSRDFG
jgi:uncharacterized RDD family membrane protein YckC